MNKKIKQTKGFCFKQFEIDGGQCGMPVSTDGVMLGAWAEVEHCMHLLDIGTGTGLLALMCAQRTQNTQIWGVDIDENAAITAQLNVANSPWAERIQIELGDINNISYPHQFDAIICNPPYFKTGAQSELQQRATARHTDSLNHLALLERCASLLTDDGKASFILPEVEGREFIALAREVGFCLSRLCEVKPTESKDVSRLLFELSKHHTECQHQQLTIHSKEGYSDAFIALTRDFYLKM